MAVWRKARNQPPLRTKRGNAQQYLTDGDWAEINEGFEEGADSREFRQLMAKIIA